MTKGNPKIILLDLETSPMLTATFSLYPESIQHSNIVQDWFILTAAWKELGASKVKSMTYKDFKTKNNHDDYGIVKAFREVLVTADVIVGHNLQKFDAKKFNARLIYHSLDPLPNLLQIDTLKEARKIASFSSNRLDYLGTHLIGEGKQSTTPGLWLKAMEGDKKALKEMKEYNEIDVVRLEELYLRLRPYIKSHIHVGAWNGQIDACRNCGSTHLTISKTRYTSAGVKKIQKICNTCHAYNTYPYPK